MPRGSALLVGVGGSGKQSLARLAAFISGLEVTQIQLKKGYGVTDLKNELSGLYLKAGLKNVGIMFLMTDAQIPNEQFLVMINDMLASGEIPDLFPDDEIENIIAGVRNEVKGSYRRVKREKFYVGLSWKHWMIECYMYLFSRWHFANTQVLVWSILAKIVGTFLSIGYENS